ncbi:MAG: hypothetical protein IPN42_12270 [Methylococcaceae bacterium]|nr:hypothetical protein [Methylococcaceae bacterium]
MCKQQDDIVLPNDDVILPKEGETVTWRGNRLLIIKAVLGQRRKHIEKNLFYPLVEEQFIGQFPIDYVPIPFPKLTQKEAIALEVAEEKRLKKYGDQPMHNDIEFNLMLNGSTVIPTNLDTHNDGVDHPDQIKVRISRYELFYDDFFYKRGELINSYKQTLSNWGRPFDEWERLNIDTKVSKAGVSCYEYKERFYKEGASKECLVHSDTPLAPDYHFYVAPEDLGNYIAVNRYVAGYILFWYADKKHIYRAKEIDAAIWRLLEAWNVSPFQAPPLQAGVARRYDLRWVPKGHK